MSKKNILLFFSLWLVSVLFSSFVLFLFYRNFRDSELKIIQSEESYHIDKITELSQLSFEELILDMLIQASHTELEAITDLNDNIALKALTIEYKRFIKYRSIYDKIRVIDLYGKERIRVDKDPGNTLLVPEEYLQDKKHRYYFTELLNLKPNEIYMSYFDLNIENQEIEKPNKPMIRLGISILDKQGETIGYLILNYLGQNILNLMQRSSYNTESQVMMVNSDGYWLKGRTRDEEWGFLFEDKKEVLFSSAYPEAWAEIRNKNSGQVHLEKGLFTFNTIDPSKITQLAGNTMSKVVTCEKDHSLKIISYIPAENLQQSFSYVRKNILLISFILMSLLAIIFYLAALFSHRKHKMAVEKEKLISKLKNANYELKKAREKADTSNKAKSSFLTNMSHELRTPLNSITGYCQLLERQRENPLSEKQVKNVKIISENGKYLLEMVNDILDLAKVEEDRFAINKQQFNFNQLLTKMPTFFGTIAYRKKLHISVNVDSEICWFYGDETRLKQVVYNLLSNAIKFSPPDTNIELYCYNEEKNVVITIMDEGSGIPDSELESIFEAFEKVENPYQQMENGTGLGLSISRKIIEGHGGRISVESRLGEGSRFTITLPYDVHRNNITGEKVIEDKNYSIEFNFQNSRLLYIEDNSYTQDLIKDALSSCKCIVDCVETGHKGLSQILKYNYNLILMDILLPDGNGLDFMKNIKEQFTDIPIIAFTASAMSGDKEHYLNEGFDAYLSKPINLHHLKETLNSFINP